MVKRRKKPSSGNNNRGKANKQDRRRRTATKKRRQTIFRKRRTTRSKRRGNILRHLADKMWSRLFSIGLTLLILTLLGVAWFAHDLPNLDKLQTFERSPGIMIYDHSDQLIASYGDIVGNYIKYEQLPKSLINAVLATEDRRFFEHSGMDIWGLARAMVANIKAGSIVQGGSTVTQQLAKNVFLTPKRTIKRKIQELLLSFWLENHFSKQEIFEIYLNRVYLGAGSYGVDAAARKYFGKSATEINLHESALLAGLLKAPSRYAPTNNAQLAKQRTKQVLLNMQDAGMLSEQATNMAINQLDIALKFKKVEAGSTRYFTDWVIDKLPKYIGRIEGDLIVKTTLDSKLQLTGEKIITNNIEKVKDSKNVTQAALVAMEPDGAIRAIIGGINYNNSQYNRATQAMRQPGSAFKLFVYLAAIEAGRTPNSWVEDKPVQYGRWAPKNYGHNYLGDILLREAFYRSINTVAAQLANEVGANRIIEMARRLGITAKLKADLSLALGTNEVSLLEMTTAYAHLASGGKRVTAYAITHIRQKDGRFIYKRKPSKSGYVIRNNVARMMNDLLTDTVERGTGKNAYFGRPAAGKTGTSQDFRDAWFIGFTPHLVTGIWVGNDDNAPMRKVTGGSVPALIWRDFMRTAHIGKPALPIEQMFSYTADSLREDEAMIGPSPNTKNNNHSANILPWQRATSSMDGKNNQRPTRQYKSIFEWFDNMKTNTEQ